MKNYEIRELTKAVGNSDMDEDIIEAVNEILNYYDKLTIEIVELGKHAAQG